MISATLACANVLQLQKDIEELDRAGTEFYHIDIMDGHYVPNICLNFEFINAVRSISKTPMDVHLMVTDPLAYIKRLADSGVGCVSAHINVLKDDAGYFIEKVHKYSMKAGLVLSPKDSVEMVLPYIAQVDYLLVMLVEPGFYGQAFMAEMVSKIRKLNEIREKRKLSFLIEADGGIGWDNIGLLKQVGLDIAVAGVFAVFGQKDSLYEAAVKFRKISNDPAYCCERM